MPIYTEMIPGHHGFYGMCASGYSLKKVYNAERCSCGDPEHCSCRVVSPPVPQIPYARKDYDSEMEETLFYCNRPMLLWTIYHTKNPDNKMLFICKIETEIMDEIRKMNKVYKGNPVWAYYEEEEYNRRAKAEYKDMVDQLARLSKLQ